MSRVLPVVLLLLLSGCRNSDAVQALIQRDSGVLSNCIVVELRDSGSSSGEPQYVPLPDGKTEAKVAVFRQSLPETVTLRVSPYWSARQEACSAEGKAELVYNGRSQDFPVTFTSGDVTTQTLTLKAPESDEDFDRDGFVASSLDGPDCDDKSALAHPKVTQEACDASADLNCNGALGCDDKACTVPACSYVATALSFTPFSMEPGVGECVAVTVERRDKNGDLAMPNYGTSLQVSTDNTAGLSFHSDSDCLRPALASLFIDKRFSSARFYVKGVSIGSRKLLANAEGLRSASLDYALRAGDATQVALLGDNQPVVAGACTKLTLERRDVYGNATGYGRKTVNLSPSPAARTAFYSDATCTAGRTLTSTEFANQAAQLAVYFKSEVANAFILRFTGLGPEVTRNQTVNADVPSKISLELTPPSAGKTLLAGECSKLATVRTLDRFDNPSSPASNSFALSGPAGLGVSFYLDAACGSATATAPVAGTAGTAGFYYKIKTGGTPVELTAAASDALIAKQSLSVTPTVRRDLCTLPANGSGVECTITPKLNNRSRSFLVFQATSKDPEPRSSFVRCKLKDDDKVVCNRSSSAGQAIQVQWQVVELPDGIKVQQVEPTCSGAATSVSAPIQKVLDPSKALILVSSSTSAPAASARTFATARFNGDFTAVDMATNNTQPCNTAIYVVQVVEWDKWTVSRGALTSDVPDSPFYAADSFTAEEATRSVVLSTYQTPADDEKKNLCNRALRSEVDTAGARLIFSRGFDTFCNVPKLSSVAWERIQFPANTVVQVKTLSVANGVSGTTAALSPVDPSRTLLLASSQSHNGQSTGETNHVFSDTIGIVAGRLTLKSSTELELVRDAFASPVDPAKPDGARWTVYAVQLEP